MDANTVATSAAQKAEELTEKAYEAAYDYSRKAPDLATVIALVVEAREAARCLYPSHQVRVACMARLNEISGDVLEGVAACIKAGRPLRRQVVGF